MIQITKKLLLVKRPSRKFHQSKFVKNFLNYSIYEAKEIVYWQNESGTKEENNKMLGLEHTTVQQRCGETED